MRILVGISGGVDSAVAVKQLISAGHSPEGAVIIMHEGTELTAAREAAESLGIPLHEIDKRQDFERIVVSDFINEYKAGRTPNPCIICNSEVKFAALYSYAMENGFDAVATGHYARVVAIRDGEIFENTPELIEKNIKEDGFGKYTYSVALAEDGKKDQTYMLWRVPSYMLERTLFPLFGINKEEARAIARSAEISAADREESQEICFIPDNDYPSFIENREGKSQNGAFLDEDGAKIGEHKGIIRYTVGQRRGLGVSAEARLYVKDINPAENTVTLSYDMPEYKSFSLSGVRFSGLAPVEYGREYEFFVKIRYSQKMIPSRVVFSEDKSARVTLDTPARLISPGQSAVFYKNSTIMAGGFIVKGE